MTQNTPLRIHLLNARWHLEQALAATRPPANPDDTSMAEEIIRLSGRVRATLDETL